MSTEPRTRLLCSFVIVGCLLFGTDAWAAQVRLQPFLGPPPGPVTFQVLLDEAPNGALDATVELRVEGSLLFMQASAIGNPFLFPGVSTSSAGCQDGAPICARFGGSSFGNTVPGPTIVLGELTIASNGGHLDVFVSSLSRYTDPILGSVFLNEGEYIGGLPEPATIALLAMGAAALAASGRRTR